MASALDDLLLRGLTGRTPWKAECDACATSNVTRSGEQTVDGVSLEAGDRCLLTGQTAPKENGLYVVATDSWVRAADFSDAATARVGTLVNVLRGTSNAGLWRLTSPTSGTITPGVTSTTWERSLPGFTVDGDLAVTGDVAITGALTVGGSPVGAAATDALTAKLAVRARMPAQTAIPSTLVTDGGVTAVAGDRILLDSLSTAAERGIYIAASGSAWTRAGDFNATADIADGALVLVVAGTDAGKLYQLDQLDATLGTTALSFTQVGGSSLTAGDGLTLTGSDLDIDTSDTAVFTTSGAVSRVPVIDGSGVITAETADVLSTLKVGSNVDPVATTGLIRLPTSGPQIVVRNAANSGDLNVLNIAATDVITVGDASGTLNLIGSSVTVNGSAIGGGSSYTFGDGLTLAGSDVDIDLTDTTIFTTSGAASRVPVLDGSSYVPCSGATSTGSMTVTGDSASAGLIAFDDGGSSTLDLFAGAVANVTAPTITVESSSASVLKHTRPSTDVRPPVTHLVMGQATSLASGSTTAANKIGPHMAIALGRGQTTGTDEPGSLFIGLGDTVGSAIAGGVIFGDGAPVGTAGTDAYRPFTTERGRIRTMGNEFAIDAGFLFMRSTSGGVTVRAGAGTLALQHGVTQKIGITSTATTINGTTVNVATGAGEDVNICGATGDLGFFGVTAVSRATALTAADASAVNSGDATTDTVINNLRTRLNELETKLQAYGLLS